MTHRHPHRLGSVLVVAALAGAALLGEPRAADAQLTALGNAQIHQCDGSPDPCEAGDQLGSAVAVGDFDGDGFDDLAVGVPYEDLSGGADAGAVHVFYGSPGGLRLIGDQILTQSTSGVAGAPEANDRWGWSLAAGRFNLDAYDDLAIGGPYEDLTVGGSAKVDAGAVWVLFGSANGLTGSGSLSFDQETPPISGESIEANDLFGEVLAAAPSFRSTVHDTLVIGTPHEDGVWGDEGRVITLSQYSGNPLASAELIDQSAFYGACGELGESWDEFGAALGVDYRRTAGNLLPNFDLVVGAPGESFGGVSDAGRLGALYHNSSTAQCWDQDSPGVQGAPETYDEFASALALGDFDADGDSDLAIGVPREALSGFSYAGAVQVLYNNGSVLTGNSPSWFDQDGFTSSAIEWGDNFGRALAVGDFDGDGAADLAIGVPFEDLDVSGSSKDQAGEVNVVYGAQGTGLSLAGSQTFNQTIPSGMVGTPGREDRFGYALAAGDFDGNGSDDLAIGVPGDIAGGEAEAGTVQVVYGLDGDTGAFGTVKFASSALTLNEAAGPATVTILRAQSSVVAASVGHSRTGGSATPAVDFTYTPGTASWSAGDDSFELLTFSVLQDTLDEPNETIVFALANPSAGTALGSPATVTVTIVDDDVAGSLQFGAASYSVAEAGGSATITVTRSGGAASGVTVHYETYAAGGGTATASQDYTPVSGTLTFAAAETSRTFLVPILNDMTDEPNETLALRLTSPGGGGTLGSPAIATLTILDDDPVGRLFLDGFESGGTTAWSWDVP